MMVDWYDVQLGLCFICSRYVLPRGTGCCLFNTLPVYFGYPSDLFQR